MTLLIALVRIILKEEPIALLLLGDGYNWPLLIEFHEYPIPLEERSKNKI